MAQHPGLVSSSVVTWLGMRLPLLFTSMPDRTGVSADRTGVSADSTILHLVYIGSMTTYLLWGRGLLEMYELQIEVSGLWIEEIIIVILHLW